MYISKALLGAIVTTGIWCVGIFFILARGGDITFAFIIALIAMVFTFLALRAIIGEKQANINNSSVSTAQLERWLNSLDDKQVELMRNGLTNNYSDEDQWSDNPIEREKQKRR
jgi:hypothetical protein